MKNFNTKHTKQHENIEIFFKNECYEIYGCIYTVYTKLGIGFLEAVYQEALEIELSRKNILFISQRQMEIIYDGIPLKNKYIADLVCYEKIIIELKSVSKINNQHKAQLMNYMTVSDYKLGLLVNFNYYPKAEIVRLVR
jgi:GxxExxY protein